MTKRRSSLCLFACALAVLVCLPAISSAQQSPAPSVQSDAPVLAQPAPDADAPVTPAPDTFVSDASQPAQTSETLPQDLSPMGMYRAAHWVVQAVMISLGVACFVTWTVLVFKGVEMIAVNRRLRRSAAIIRAGDAMAAVARAMQNRTDPAAFMALAALDEMRKSDPVLAVAGPAGVKERVRSMLDRVEVQAGKRLRRGTGLLATIGSTAPFVGLFGTVWGIMNAFIRISETKSTNLAVVAPGIAEALLATAIGLVAAIPAVVIYNHFARSIANYRVMLGDAGAGIERLVSRDLDFLAAKAAGAQTPASSPMRARA